MVSHRKPDVSPEHTPRLALTIRQFCDAHNISEAFYFKLRRQGQAPRSMKIGSRTLISFEAAAAWRVKCEATSAAETETA